MGTRHKDPQAWAVRRKQSFEGLARRFLVDRQLHPTSAWLWFLLILASVYLENPYFKSSKPRVFVSIFSVLLRVTPKKSPHLWMLAFHTTLVFRFMPDASALLEESNSRLGERVFSTRAQASLPGQGDFQMAGHTVE